MGHFLWSEGLGGFDWLRRGRMWAAGIQSEMALDSTVYDKGHVHWSLAAQDVLVLPLNNRVTSASYLTLFCGPVCLCVKL